MTTKTTKKSAVKGTVAAAAGVAVLLGGMGTFALWNQSGDIGTGSTGTGHLTAEFPSEMTWQDKTDGAVHDIANIGSFKMVPGDVLVGTYDIPVSLQGENLSVTGTLDIPSTGMPDGVDATVTLTDGTASPTDTLVLTGSNDGEDYTITAEVTLTFDEDTDNQGAPSPAGSMDQTVDLSTIKVALQQNEPANIVPAP
ncbi:alternate-type signal peptide domain-containing protein [Luteimicrobium sp. NPDC057192]|uniref:alternate-type signal peptide domain-containing protein n=1 Tax=Luteimicrobium sp. NPDC057192 TaxID=3346042 RepID=UPI0036303169